MTFRICIYLTLLLAFAHSESGAQGISVNDLNCEYKKNPNGIHTSNPRFSWKLVAPEGMRSVTQVAYQLQVASSPNELVKGNPTLWDTGRKESDQSVLVPYEGPALKSRKVYYWRVRVWNGQKSPSAWSPTAFWEMGLLDSTDWVAEWIEPELEEKEKEYNPAPMLRRDFRLDDNIETARLYISSHGVYEAFINGQRVGEELFTPGWTSFHKRLQYQTYDVTDLLTAGSNAAGVRLGDGWFRGQFGWQDNWNVYGTKLALLFQLEVQYADGRTQVISSDSDWKASTGAIVSSSIYDGEIYDARLEKVGWNQSGYLDQDWKPVRTVSHSKGKLVGPEAPPVRRMEIVKVKDIFRTPKGDLVADFGQNLVGWVRLRCKGQAGDDITLHHAEVLDREGNFYTANLRSAQQKVRYILKDNQERTFEPHFTFQGFRYIKVEGFPGQLSPDNLEAVVIYSDMERTGTFECSNPMLNQLQRNIEWGQKSNFLDVPTDCPQRDERMGWTGDAQAFASTASFNFNTAAFFTKWLQDLKADQLDNGSVPFVVPDVLGASGSTGWGDAATIVPWTLYLKFGDVRILERQYESMKGWVAYLEELSEGNYLVQKGDHFGDWLFFIHPTDWNAKPGHTDIDFLATAFFAHSTELTRQAAGVLKRPEDVKYYSELRSNIERAFQQEFLTPSGRLSPHSQTAYTLALAFDLLPEGKMPRAAEYLVKDITARKFHLSTGFLGSTHLTHVLSSNGYTDVAYKLLFQETYPSWLYPITRGATTIWERWDGIKPDSSFQDDRMNSFNHYAYGAIGDWMYRVVAGIEADPEIPGYKHILIQPQPDPELSYVKATYESGYGSIMSEWKLEDSRFQLEVAIPPNTTATLKLPGAELPDVTEGQRSLGTVPGISNRQQEANGVMLEVGSGNYLFSYPVTR